MENRPSPLRSRRVCRFCLTESEPLSFIYERDHSKPFQVPLTLQIMSCVAIEVYAADGMPQMICSVCRWNLDRSYKFKIQCKKADEALRAYPVSGVLPRPFPPIPNTPSDSANKRGPEQRMQNESAKKVKLEVGERERREQREQERQDKQAENSDQHDMYDDDQDGGSDGEQENSNDKDSRKLEPGEIRVHACDHCDKTFPLRAALVAHNQRAHRDRTFKCTKCDKIFYSKYDLGNHMSSHAEEKPYSCQICSKQFTRLNLLQRHEKVHRDELRYGCQHCEREFFSTDELEKHEATAHKNMKPYQCNICNKRFTYRQGLERHELLHSDDKTFVCEYCKEAFRSSTKLARHLSTHPAHRPYVCKLCPRSFLLSHHLTRHMRTHSVEKPHSCEECGKAFKRKESLEVHQLTHAKRGMGLTCEICQESCRNRADYVIHIKQHIEAGEKMGSDGLRPDLKKDKTVVESDEDEETYTDGDDNDYEPPAHIAKKIPKMEPPESDEEVEKSERKEQVVYVRNADGNVVKKTIKTLMPIQRRDISEHKTRSGVSGSQSAKSTPVKSDNRNAASENESTPKVRSQYRVDDTEAEVQKIVASVFKEHKIPLKHQNIPQEQSKDASNATPSQAQTRSQHAASSNSAASSKDDVSKSDGATATPKTGNTVKVIKRIVVRKPLGGIEAAQAIASSTKENEGTSTPGSGSKVTKRVIVRRIIRHGDTTREVILNPDGTMLDPTELAKLPTRNVVKRVILKKPKDQGQTGNQSVDEQPSTKASSAGETKSADSSKSDGKSSGTPRPAAKSTSNTAQKQSDVTPRVTRKMSEAQAAAAQVDDENSESTKEKLEKLEKRVEQQRLKIEELQARKQQESDLGDDMLPERHDESEEEQQLPLKRVFVKRKQSIYDEEQEYESDDGEPVVKKEEKAPVEKSANEKPVKDYKKPVVTSTSKVYGNKKIILVKSEEPMEDDDQIMTEELTDILDSTENVVKMQENMLSNLNQVSTAAESAESKATSKNSSEKNTDEEMADVSESTKTVPDPSHDALLHDLQSDDKSEDAIVESQDDGEENISEDAVGNESGEPDSSMLVDEQDATSTPKSFAGSNSVSKKQKSEATNLDDSVMVLPDETITLNDANESQDSIEDKLSQLDS